jgi:site-specific DNA recombinase
MTSLRNSTLSDGRQAAIYCRVSTRAQDDDGTSLETQEAACRRYAAEHGYVVDDTAVFREVYTGTELWDRPLLSALRARIRQGEVGVVIAYAIDRLSRDPVHLGVVISEAEHVGVRVEFVTEPLDDSNEGQLIRFVRGYAAKVEHEKIRERALRGKIARAKAGALLPGRFCPLGYQWAIDERGRQSAYAIDPETAPIVVKLFTDTLAGKSLRQLAKDLDAAGVPTATGSPRWAPSTLAGILKNPAYKGEVIGWAVRTTKGRKVLQPESEWIRTPVPPIVDPAVWQAVQVALVDARHVSRHNAEPEQYLLRGGFVRCGLCGHVAVAYRHRYRSGNMSYRYACLARRNGVPCREHTIIAETLDGPIWKLCAELALQPEIIEARLREQRDEPTLDADAAAIERALRDVERKQQNLARLVADLDDADAAAPLLAELTALGARRRALEEARAEVAGRAERLATAAADAEQRRIWLSTLANKLDDAPYAVKRDVLRALGVTVWLYPLGSTPRWEMEWSPLWEDGNVITSGRSLRSPAGSDAGWRAAPGCARARPGAARRTIRFSPRSPTVRRLHLRRSGG